MRHALKEAGLQRRSPHEHHKNNYKVNNGWYCPFDYRSGQAEHEPHTRLLTMGKVTQHTNAYNQQLLSVDVAGINRRIMLLPGEVSKTTCSHMEKSADTIVPVKRKLSPKVK